MARMFRAKQPSVRDTPGRYGARDYRLNYAILIGNLFFFLPSFLSFNAANTDRPVERAKVETRILNGAWVNAVVKHVTGRGKIKR